jgi:hypothetical protein
MTNPITCRRLFGFYFPSINNKSVIDPETYYFLSMCAATAIKSPPLVRILRYINFIMTR